MSVSAASSPVTFDRREFLLLAAGAAGVALHAAPLWAADLGQELPTHRFRIRRDRDLLSLEFSFVNFERRSDVLHAISAGRSLVIVRFPPQNLAEARFDKSGGLGNEPTAGEWPPKILAEELTQPRKLPPWEETPLPLPVLGEQKYSPVPPVASYLSGPSWVVFAVPDLTQIPLTLAAAHRLDGSCGTTACGTRTVSDVWLRNMSEWPIRVPANAVTPGRPGMPAGDETCLEIPFRLFISPKSTTTKWITSSTRRLWPLGPRSTAVELWHAALHDRTKLTPATPPPDLTNLPPELAPPKRVTVQARAVFSPDYQEQGEPTWDRFYPGKLPLSHRALVRHLLVKQMTKEGDGWIDAEHLILSPLGADASLSYYMQKTFREIHDAQLAGNPEANASRLAIWKHRIVVGRDTFLLSVWTGFLFPFVYPALFVELTRRSFASRRHNLTVPMEEVKDVHFGPPGAYLITEYFILAQDPVKQFGGSDQVIGRKMPLKKATLLETRSPLVRPPTDINTPFVPLRLTGGAAVRWPIEFVDEAGNVSRTSDACLLFATNVKRGHQAWEQQTTDVRKWSMPAQRINLAPDEAKLVSPDAAVPVHSLTNDERNSAGTIAREIQTVLGTVGHSLDEVKHRLAGLETSVNELPEKAKVAAERLQSQTRKRIAELIREYENDGEQKEEIIEKVLRQLSNAEKAATDVETHAIEFGSRSVNQLFKTLQSGIPPALTAAASPAAFRAALNSLVGNDAQELSRLNRELDGLWLGSTGAWPQQHDEALRFLREMEHEAKNAENFLRHGFQPQFVAADVVVPALKAMGGSTGPQPLELIDAYAAKGIDRVKNSVFGQFTQTIDDGKAMAEKIKCAVASPAAKVAGLSRDLGGLVGAGKDAVEELAKQADGFDLSQAIPDFKLLGVLPLSKIVSSVLSGAELPSINLQTLPDHVEQIWEWNAKLTEKNLGILTFVPDPDKTKLPVHLSIKTTTRIDVPQPGQSAAPTGRVQMNGLISYWDRSAKKAIPYEENDPHQAFTLQLLKLIHINFVDVSFRADYEVGQTPRPKISPRLGTIEFQPPLDFVKKLQEMLPVFGKGFEIVQTPGRIGISYEFALPAIAFGAFSLRNLAIGTAVMFSLESKPLRFDFNFASWKEPFELTVMCFGGRGFLKIAADTAGYRDLQGMIEFGGALSFDVGVASGGLYVMAGIYFRITSEITTVAGFVRAGGCLDVLGLIHASVEFLLMVSYVKSGEGSKLAGEATVTVCIDLFLVSFDVSIRMYKEFSGSGSSPETTGLYDHDNPVRFVTQQAASTEPPILVQAYFARPAVGKIPATLGRFESVKKWNEDYWSQFAL